MAYGADLAAMTGLLGTMVGGMINYAGNYDLALYEANRNERLIEKQNEYNSPKMQMQRYMEAGLNPNLIYGNGQSSAGNQSQVAQYHRPDFNLGDSLSQGMKMAMDIALQQKEIELKDAQIDNTREQQFNIRSNRMGIDMENAFKSALLDYNPGVLLMPEELASIRKSTMFNRYSAEAEGVNYLNALRKAQTEVAKFSSEHQKNIAKELDVLQVKLLGEKIRGLNLENSILEIEKNLQQRLDSIGGKSGAKLIIDILREMFSLRH